MQCRYLMTVCWTVVATLGFLAADAADQPSAEATSMRFLEVDHSTVSEPITTQSQAAAKFVRVEIAEIVNPQRAGLAFDVCFVSKEAQRMPLGTFSPFPADRPGNFIVATQGKLQLGGTLVVSMKVTDPLDENAPLKVRIKSVRFADH